MQVMGIRGECSGEQNFQGWPGIAEQETNEWE